MRLKTQSNPNLSVCRNSENIDENIIVAPTIQEFSLMKNMTKESESIDPIEAIVKELSFLRKKTGIEYGSGDESSLSSLDSNILQEKEVRELELLNRGKRKEEEVFGNILLSFFPIP